MMIREYFFLISPLHRMLTVLFKHAGEKIQSSTQYISFQQEIKKIISHSLCTPFPLLQILPKLF